MFSGRLQAIWEKRRPYARLLELLHAAGRSPQADDGARLMSNNVGLAGAAQLLGTQISTASIASLELELFAELPTIHLYPEVVATLTALREYGYKIALCSNLAAPYAVPIKMPLPFQFDAYAWSFECGVVKPDNGIYASVCKMLQCKLIGSVSTIHMGPSEIAVILRLCRV